MTIVRCDSGIVLTVDIDLAQPVSILKDRVAVHLGIGPSQILLLWPHGRELKDATATAAATEDDARSVQLPPTLSAPADRSADDAAERQANLKQTQRSNSNSNSNSTVALGALSADDDLIAFAKDVNFLRSTIDLERRKLQQTIQKEREANSAEEAHLMLPRISSSSTTSALQMTDPSTALPSQPQTLAHQQQVLVDDWLYSRGVCLGTSLAIRIYVAIQRQIQSLHVLNRVIDERYTPTLSIASKELKRAEKRAAYPLLSTETLQKFQAEIAKFERYLNEFRDLRLEARIGVVTVEEDFADLRRIHDTNASIDEVFRRDFLEASRNPSAAGAAVAAGRLSAHQSMKAQLVAVDPLALIETKWAHAASLVHGALETTTLVHNACEDMKVRVRILHKFIASIDDKYVDLVKAEEIKRRNAFDDMFRKLTLQTRGREEQIGWMGSSAMAAASAASMAVGAGSGSGSGFLAAVPAAAAAAMTAVLASDAVAAMQHHGHGIDGSSSSVLVLSSAAAMETPLAARGGAGDSLVRSMDTPDNAQRGEPNRQKVERQLESQTVQTDPIEGLDLIARYKKERKEAIEEMAHVIEQLERLKKQNRELRDAHRKLQQQQQQQQRPALEGSQSRRGPHDHAVTMGAAPTTPASTTLLGSINNNSMSSSEADG